MIVQNEKTACTKIRLAADPVLKMPPARLVDLPKFGAVTVPFGVP
jgi:hypothetical protein